MRRATEQNTAACPSPNGWVVARANTVSSHKLHTAPEECARRCARATTRNAWLTHPNTSDANRGQAGLTIPDDTKTDTSPDAISEITPPLMQLDFGIRHQVTVHWGPNPHNEHLNAEIYSVRLETLNGDVFLN